MMDQKIKVAPRNISTKFVGEVQEVKAIFCYVIEYAGTCYFQTIIDNNWYAWLWMEHIVSKHDK